MVMIGTGAEKGKEECKVKKMGSKHSIDINNGAILG